MVIAMFYAAILVIAGLGASNYSTISPQTIREYGIDEAEAAECVPMSAQDIYAEDRDPRGKLANFNSRGRYRCPKPIFAYGERSSYYELLVRNIPTAAAIAISKIKTNEDLAQGVWQVRIDDETHDTASRAYAVQYLEQALFAELGTGHVVRVGTEESLTRHILQVELRDTILAENLLGITLKLKKVGVSQERVLWKN